MNKLILLKQGLLLETERCKVLLNTQVFISDSPFIESAFIEILIRLNYVLQKLNTNGNRITWKDDIQADKDITDLINKMRNAACHSDSPENYIDNSKMKAVFNTRVGKGCLIKYGNTELGGDYDDDIAFFYGDKRVYLKRHIEKLLRELPDRINKLPQINIIDSQENI